MNRSYKKKKSAVKYRQVVLHKGGQTLVGSKSITAALSAAPGIKPKPNPACSNLGEAY